MDKKKAIRWQTEPAGKDYDAAETFLQLLYKPKKAHRWAKQLKQAKITAYAAKDILRASCTPMSEIQAFDWRKQQKEIDEGKPLSPILIVKQDNGGRLIIADGFHRMCALFANDQEIEVPCKIV
ncbi:MAG TPA: hypothetical protein VNX00_04390 [Herbaspirillum sp.]|jgi:hypothetical protein|nr:hypothetical protein [Herbaspirillum sp.]